MGGGEDGLKFTKQLFVKYTFMAFPAILRVRPGY